MLAIGEVVHRLRDEKGLTQLELERLTAGAVSRGYAANLERAKTKTPPSPEKLAALARASGVTRRYLLEETMTDPYIV